MFKKLIQLINQNQGVVLLLSTSSIMYGAWGIYGLIWLAITLAIALWVSVS